MYSIIKHICFHIMNAIMQFLVAFKNKIVNFLLKMQFLLFHVAKLYRLCYNVMDKTIMKKE